ncbi:hypothetical protein [uncultured Mediterranean phage uvMED]|nr:hypothetical protein [uncultured Mediterranean phage uvMED]
MMVKLIDGRTYRFKHNGKHLIGKYELLSGNFFSGGSRTYSDHDNYYEAASCSDITEIVGGLTDKGNE